MKKVLTLIMFAVCGLQIYGCAPTLVKSNTIQTATIEARIETAPIVADVRVEKKRVTGQAGGKINKEVTQADIISQAIADALGQNPPSASGPDLLIGANGFAEWKGKNRLTYTVTGYPGYYTNFHPAKEQDSAWLNVMWPGIVDYPRPKVPKQSVSQDTAKLRWESERWRRGGTYLLNLIPGLGSIIIMDDWNGAYVQWGLEGGGLLLAAIGNGGTLSYIGLAAFYSGWVGYNAYRSYTYPLPASRRYQSASMDNTGLKWAVLPDKDGGVKGYLAYSAKF